jgi:hypothetical protein
VPIVCKAAKLPAFIDVPPPPAIRREMAIAQKHLAAFSRAYLRVVRSIYDPSTLKAVSSAYSELRRGKLTVEQVVETAGWFNVADPLSVKRWELLGASLERAYVAVITDAGQGEIDAHGWPIKFTVQKQDVLVPINPFSMAWVRIKTASTVAEVSDQQRTLLREIIAESFEEGQRSEAVLKDIELNVGLTVRQRGWVQNFRQRLLDAGEDNVEARTEKYAALTLRRRARTIARTETIDAYAQGLDDSWGLAKEEGFINDAEVMQDWIEIPNSERTCKICRGLGESEPVPVGQPFVSEFIGEVRRPPAHPNCLPGDALVLASGVTAKTERAYQGDMIVIRTASGNKLTCTPNHPILGGNGWMAAALVQVGGYVVSSARTDWATPGVVDNQDTVPPVIQKISDLPLIMGPSSTRHVPVASHDFHGDGKGSKVAIVRAHRNLRDQAFAAAAQQLVKLGLKARDVHRVCLDCLSALAFGGVGNLATAHGGVGGRGELLALIGGHVGVPVEHSRAAAPRFDTRFEKPVPDNVPADSEGFAQRLLADPALVFADKVLSVDVCSHDGPVFNVETNTGAYIAQGVVTHNCRCTKVLVFLDEDDAEETRIRSDRDAIAARDRMAAGDTNAS